MRRSNVNELPIKEVLAEMVPYIREISDTWINRISRDSESTSTPNIPVDYSKIYALHLHLLSENVTLERHGLHLLHYNSTITLAPLICIQQTLMSRGCVLEVGPEHGILHVSPRRRIHLYRSEAKHGRCKLTLN